MRTTKTTIPCRVRMAAIAAALAVVTMAACEDMTPTTTPNTGPPSSSGSPAASTQPTCDDRAIRLLDRSGSNIHGAIIADTLHMGGESAPATCTETADLSLLAGSPMPGGRAAQVQQAQYYVIVIRYPDGNNRLYVISSRVDGTTCIVDTNDVCVATVSGLPDDFDPEVDLPDDVPPTIPGGQDAPPEQPDTGTKPDAVENPYPRNGKTGVTVAPLLSWAASPQAAHYDLYYGTTKDLADTPITTENTAVTIPRPGATDQRLAGDTTYYWRVDARNDAGATRGTVWSFTTEASEAEVPNVAGIYEGISTWITTTGNGHVGREEVMTRDRLQVWSVQLTSYDGKPITVMSKFTILEVLPGEDSDSRDYLNGSIGDGPTYGCFLYPDGTCIFERPGAVVISHTFKGNQMSVRMVEAPLRLSGTYEKVGDDPGPAPSPGPTSSPTTPEPPTQPAPAEPSDRQATCADLAIRLLDRGAGIHGAIIADTLHMGGETAPATCTEPASLATGWSMPDGRTEQAQQSQSGYYLIVINYPGGNRLYVVSRRSGGTTCVVDTNDQCIAQVTALPDDFDLEDLPEDVRPTIPGGVSPRPAARAR